MAAIQKVAVVGLGYIGLPTATMFATHGVQVVGIDVNQQAIDTINQGRIHIVEPGLEQLVHAAVQQGRLRATRTPEPAEAFLIAVPTPFKENHQPDLSYIEQATQAIAPVLQKGNVVILESTSPVGATEQMLDWLQALRPDLRFAQPGDTDPEVHVAYCPERVLPGQVIRELVENNRIIGGITPACAERAAAVYRTFVQGELLITEARTAEMSKLTENAFRDVNIAFANELSVICERLGIDVWELIRLANHHPRVNILRPGAGVGGHCIAVDPWFIVSKTPEQARLIRTAREINDAKPQWVIHQIDMALAQIATAQPVVAVLGLAFKPDIDDLRESPAMEIATALAQRSDLQLLIVEPNIDQLPAALQGQVLCTLEQALQQADLLACLVSHRQFHGVAEKISSAQRLVDVVGLR